MYGRRPKNATDFRGFAIAGLSQGWARAKKHPQGRRGTQATNKNWNFFVARKRLLLLAGPAR
jgi:hypothetical protein